MPEKKTAPARKKSVGGAKKSSARSNASRANAARRKKSAHSRKKRRNKKNSWWALPVTILMSAVLLGVGIIAWREQLAYRDFKAMRQTVDQNGYYEGVTIDGADVSGRSYQEVLASLQSREEAKKAQCSVTLAYGNQTWNITADDLDYQSDSEEVASKAYQIGHAGSVQSRYQQIREVKSQGAAFTVSSGFDESLLRVITDDVADSISYEAENASIASFDTANQSFVFTAEKNGLSVDKEQLYQSALSALRSGAGGTTVAVSAQTIAPSLTQAELQQTCGLVDSAKTRIYDSSKNRLNNIQLAVEILSGVRVDPGVTFSFNGTVGQRTAERGFKEAGAFSDGLSVQEVGGGICQVSTTLFNAVVKSDLTITTRNPHSRPVNYVDKGKDAAVSWPNQDFKFTNSSDVPVYIMGEIVTENDKKYLVMSIYGKKLPNGEYIKITAETLSELEPGEDEYRYTNDLPTGITELKQKAHGGYKAVAYKHRYAANGDEISNEVLCYSTYPAAGNIYYVGK